MTPPLVLDAAGLDALTDRPPPTLVRILLSESRRRGADVLVPAVVCTEVCRGPRRTRAVEAALSRTGGASARFRIIATDLGLARQVGAILHAAASGTEDIVDAHVVAVCVPHGGGIVVTSDPDDIGRLAATVPTTRVVSHRPDGA